MFGKIAYQINFRVLNSWLKTLLPLTFHKTLLAFTPEIPIIPLKSFHIYSPCHCYKNPLFSPKPSQCYENPPPLLPVISPAPSPASSLSPARSPALVAVLSPAPFPALVVVLAGTVSCFSAGWWATGFCLPAVWPGRNSYPELLIDASYLHNFWNQLKYWILIWKQWSKPEWQIKMSWGKDKDEKIIKREINERWIIEFHAFFNEEEEMKVVVSGGSMSC